MWPDASRGTTLPQALCVHGAPSTHFILTLNRSLSRASHAGYLFVAGDSQILFLSERQDLLSPCMILNACVHRLHPEFSVPCEGRGTTLLRGTQIHTCTGRDSNPQATAFIECFVDLFGLCDRTLNSKIKSLTQTQTQTQTKNRDN